MERAEPRKTLKYRTDPNGESSGAEIAGYLDKDLIGKSGYPLLVIESLEDVPPLWSADKPAETIFTFTTKVRCLDDGLILFNTIKEAHIMHGALIAYKGISIPVHQPVFFEPSA